MTTPIKSTPEQLHEFEAGMRGGAVCADHDYCLRPARADQTTWRHNDITPLTTAEGREEWMELLRLNVFAPGYSLASLEPDSGVQKQWVVTQAVPLAEGDSPAEAITAAVDAACQAWHEGRG